MSRSILGIDTRVSLTPPLLEALRCAASLHQQMSPSGSRNLDEAADNTWWARLRAVIRLSTGSEEVANTADVVYKRVARVVWRPQRTRSRCPSPPRVTPAILAAGKWALCCAGFGIRRSSRRLSLDAKNCRGSVAGGMPPTARWGRNVVARRNAHIYPRRVIVGNAIPQVVVSGDRASAGSLRGGDRMRPER